MTRKNAFKLSIFNLCLDMHADSLVYRCKVKELQMFKEIAWNNQIIYDEIHIKKV